MFFYVELDPEVIRFTHSRIRPFFSGCGAKVLDTLNGLMNGLVLIENIPTITAIAGQDGNYYSLNNRRLYVFKELKRAGKLPNGTIKVRVKHPLNREKQRYTAERCSLNATLMRINESKEENEETC